MSGAAITARGERPSLLTLGQVETRKMLDTRSGAWLIALAALASVGAVVAEVLAGEPETLTMGTYFSDSMLAATILLPIVPILLVTGEWTQRTALFTFALVPIRGRILLGKLLAVAALLIAVTLLSVIVAVVATAVAGSVWEVDTSEAARVMLYEVLATLFGFGLAALLMNTPAAIVLNFATALIIGSIAAISESVGDAIAWIDPGAWSALTEGVTNGEEWAKIATATVAWVVIPIALGALRLRRRDVS